MHEDDLRIQARPETYFGSGFLDAWTVLTMLDACSFDLGSLRSVLEFGCGTGRVIRHFRNMDGVRLARSEEHTSELQSLMRISYAVFCLKKKKKQQKIITQHSEHTEKPKSINDI